MEVFIEVIVIALGWAVIDSYILELFIFIIVIGVFSGVGIGF